MTIPVMLSVMTHIAPEINPVSEQECEADDRAGTNSGSYGYTLHIPCQMTKIIIDNKDTLIK